MNVTYKWVNWTFDRDLWSQTIDHAVKLHGISDLAEMTGLSEAILLNWQRGYFHKEFPWPHMSNFLMLTNLLDLDPRKFFVLEDE
jgi:hypothetical protein